MPLGVAGWVGLASTAYVANEGKKTAKKNRASQEGMANSQLELSKEEYATYKEKILPLELEAKELGITSQDLAVQRGQKDLDLYNEYYAPLQKDLISEAKNVAPQYDRVARDAAEGVDGAFGRQKDIEQRNAQRMGLRPDSGSYKGMDRDREINQAGVRSFAINSATERERDRIDNTKFNRMSTALGRQPGAPTPRQSAPNPSMPAGLSNAYGDQAAAYGRRAASAEQGVGDAIYTGAKLYSQFKTPTTQTQVPNGFAGGDYSGVAGDADSMMGAYNQNKAGQMFADGGLVEGQRGVDNVPATINNNEPAALSDGEFVIPRDVVMKKGTDFFEKMLEQYHEGAPPKRTAGLNENVEIINA